MKFLGKYMQIKKRNAGIAWKKAKMSKTCYLFLLPYFILFTVFYILPVVMSIFYSFTYYNVLEPAKFIGFENYIDLLLADDVFLIAVKNTFLLMADGYQVYDERSYHRRSLDESRYRIPFLCGRSPGN